VPPRAVVGGRAMGHRHTARAPGAETAGRPACRASSCSAAQLQRTAYGPWRGLPIIKKEKVNKKEEENKRKPAGQSVVYASGAGCPRPHARARSTVPALVYVCLRATRAGATSLARRFARVHRTSEMIIIHYIKMVTGSNHASQIYIYITSAMWCGVWTTPGVCRRLACKPSIAPGRPLCQQGEEGEKASPIRNAFHVAPEPLATPFKKKKNRSQPIAERNRFVWYRICLDNNAH